ncbi:hypothetical protein [Pedobacter mucosus]|uniref:hypothetical protein n=1 Tax=Pedobacter mucosus TaxID=2895286 RepID=UPI001EE40CDF|nr:hypothetical protein [Pedobacter mucosus]UKT66092.1 hypothetical protein LOK61_09920 [Pedobacter mucosus]
MNIDSRKTRKIRKSPLKIFTAIFGIYILISVLSLIPALSKEYHSLRFIDGVKQMIFNLFYIFIGFNLYRLFYTSEKTLNDLVTSQSLKRLANIWYCLVALLTFKVAALLLIKFYIIPFAADKHLADSLGYSVNMPIAPNSDLLIAIVIVWVFLYVVGFALKLKQENDLTI